ncbi:MAG: fatty acid CoA ligase FadD32 [Solirubrobacteraceae bacterium]|jgi:fatty acid CoA ligase FadD32|nr:fatty acid CoA ligase FadD32 [Solirubrobacteraceae bacterium]
MTETFPEVVRDPVTHSPVESLVSSLARRRALDQPAFTWVDYSAERGGVHHTLTWSEFYARVLAVAAKIREVADTSARVAVLCPQDLSYPVAFFGALVAGTTAVPLFAPEVSSHADRLIGALADCEPTVWLTAEGALGSVEKLLDDPRVPRPAGGVIAVDSVDVEAGRDFEPPAIDLSATAYLQYTSGSTRSPAGAVITHEAVATNVLQAAAAFDLSEDSTCVGWVPFFHDMGLVLLACVPVGLGARSVFATPFDFIRRPLGWLEQLARHPNVITAAPNFAFDYAIDRTSAEDRSTLDLSGVRVAINGAEPVRPRTVQRFQETFGPCGFAAAAQRPTYGLAEATVFVTATDAAGPKMTTFARSELMVGRAMPALGDTDAITLVSAGAPVDQQVCIVDPADCRARPNGEVGEVWVHGRNVAIAYWGQPERSGEVFDARLVGGDDELPAAGWLRTGDLGVTYDGELYITGRLKDLIIVDGKNHYPQDIEETVQEAHPAVRTGRVAVFGIPTEVGEALVVVMERARHADADGATALEISLAVRRAVSAAHDLKLRDVQILDGQKVLRTSSGKIARAANRDRYVAQRES